MLASTRRTPPTPAPLARADCLAPVPADVTVYSRTRRESHRALAQAEGFLVDDPDGPVGVVEEIRSMEGKGDPEIVVACGWFGRHRLTVHADDVEEILPAERLLILRPGLPQVEATRRRRTPVAERLAKVVRGLLGSRRGSADPRTR